MRLPRPLLSLILLLSTACGGVLEIDVEDGRQSAAATTAAQAAVTPTLPGFTETPPAARTPAAVTPVPPVVVPDSYRLLEERFISGYTIQIWYPTNTQVSRPVGFVTMDSRGQLPIRVGRVYSFGPETGTDINGNGIPEVMFNTHSGGEYCCYGLIIFELGQVPLKLWPPGQIDTPQPDAFVSVPYKFGLFVDSNRDGIMEISSYEPVQLDNVTCPGALLQVLVIYEYSTNGYRPASPKFPLAYFNEIRSRISDVEMETGAASKEEWELHPKHRCHVLMLVLTYLYSGQTEEAWSVFDRAYMYSDAKRVRADIERSLQNSSVYVAPSNGSEP